MDKNAVAFIRNDVRTLSCVFLPFDKGDYTLESLSREAMLRLTSGEKVYTYLTTEQEIQTGDFAIVMAGGKPKVVYIKEAFDELLIEPNASYEFSFVVSRVDFSKYNQLLSQNKAIWDTLKSSYQASLREGFRQTLLNGLPEDKRNSITLLLSKGG